MIDYTWFSILSVKEKLPPLEFRYFEKYKISFIGENTRLVYDLMQLVEENNIPGLLLLIDFEKAFDSLSWTIMKNVLTTFNFGPSILQWISTFYNKTQAAINQGSNLSSFFNIERGCKQGDPISL